MSEERFYKIERKGYLTKWVKGPVDEKTAKLAYNNSFNAYAPGRTEAVLVELSKTDWTVATRGLPVSPNNGLKLQVLELDEKGKDIRKVVLLRKLKEEAEAAAAKEAEAEAAKKLLQSTEGSISEELANELAAMRQLLADSQTAQEELRNELTQLKAAEPQTQPAPEAEKKKDK